jgi:hypothetical protein
MSVHRYDKQLTTWLADLADERDGVPSNDSIVENLSPRNPSWKLKGQSHQMFDFRLDSIKLNHWYYEGPLKAYCSNSCWFSRKQSRKSFQKALVPILTGFYIKAIGNFMKKSAKNCWWHGAVYLSTANSCVTYSVHCNPTQEQVFLLWELHLSCI